MNKTEVAPFNYSFLVLADQKDQPFFSLDPKESDLAINQKILNALIGTLVNYGNSGKIEPYLAQKIEISPDKLRWNFILRKGLFCEDGSPINAYSFKEVLEKRLLDYAKKGSVLNFDNLVGWHQFLAGGQLAGLQAKDDLTLTFLLTKEENQFLEYLRMPYFGFWCTSNFENDSIKNKFSVVSSGAYKIGKVSNGKELELVARNDWFSVTSESPSKIIFSAVTRESIGEARPYTMVDMGLNSPEPTDESSYHFIFGVPTFLTNIVLNPHNGFFASSDNRRKFASEMFDNPFKASSKNRVRSNFFFLHKENKMSYRGTRIQPFEYTATKDTITFAVSTRLSERDLNPLKEAIKKALSNFTVEFVKPDKSVKDWFELLQSNSYYSARITSVDAGGSFAKAPVKMMFCSDLGVRYPDPSGRICALANEYESEDKEIDNTYVDRFNQILFDDAAVIPVYFGSTSWLVSKDIDLDSIPSSVNYFQYEKLRFR